MKKGFTIVELLIVIVVIGILAAIAILAYTGIQQKAVAASLTTDLENSAKQLKIYQATNSTYPTSIDCSASPVANSICLKTSTGTTYTTFTPNNTDPQTFCLTATNGSTSYFVNQDGAPASGPCSITNLALNPNTELNSANIAGMGNASGTVLASNEQAKYGSYSLKTTSTSGRKWMTNDTFAVGDIIKWSMWMYPVGTAQSFSTYFESSLPSTIGSGGGSSVVAPANTWTQLAGTYTLTSGWAGRGNYGFGILRIGAAVGDGVVVYYDGAMITRGSGVYNFADGSSPGWSWTGTANASTSTGPPL